MKYRKPDYSTASWESVRKFLDSLPAEFEILGPGETAVKWPKEYTREVLTYLAEKIDVQIDAEHYQPGQSRALAALAAIAPERKKRMVKRWVWADSEGRVCWSADSISHAAGAILVEVPVVED